MGISNVVYIPDDVNWVLVSPHIISSTHYLWNVGYELPSGNRVQMPIYKAEDVKTLLTELQSWGDEVALHMGNVLLGNRYTKKNIG